MLHQSMIIDPLTRSAIRHTLHCLVGCGLGEVLGMIIGTAFNWPDAPTIFLAIILAFFFGYLLTFFSVRRAGLKTREAVKTAVATDSVSITSMEIVDNLVIIVIPNVLAASLATRLFWGSLTLSLFVAFWVTVPINRWFIGRNSSHNHIHH